MKPTIKTRNMSYEKFNVEELETTPSGNYAKYKNKNGTTTWVRNFGYKVGDVVEVWDFDGYAPKRIDVNGKTIWTENDRFNWWKLYDPQSEYLINPYRIINP